MHMHQIHGQGMEVTYTLQKHIANLTVHQHTVELFLKGKQVRICFSQLHCSELENRTAGQLPFQSHRPY